AAAEALGVNYADVSVFIGDSDLPPAPVAGGSNSTASTCSAVVTVCNSIRQRLRQALTLNQSPADQAKATVGLGRTPAGEPTQGDASFDREKAFDALGTAIVEEYGEWKPEGAPADSFQAMHQGQMRMV